MKTSSIRPATATQESYRRWFLLVCLIYLGIACLLAVLIRYDIMDEKFHLETGKIFVRKGLNLQSLYEHLPPTGVASHLWYAFWMWLLPSTGYLFDRLTTCFFLAMITWLAYRRLKNTTSAFQRMVLTGAWFTLVSPYFFVSTSIAMTEGPALVFVFAGLLALWDSNYQQLWPFFLGCVFLGLATVARFYFVPLLPALFVAVLVSDWQDLKKVGFGEGLGRRLIPYGLIGVGLLPLVGLALLWGGLTPPLFNQQADMKSGVSFNGLRPFSALLITGVYISPFVFLNLPERAKQLKLLLVVAVIALALVILNVNLFKSSPIWYVYSGPIEHTLAWIRVRNEVAMRVCLFGAYLIGGVSIALVIQRAVDYVKNKEGLRNKAFVYSAAFVVLFWISQAFVGGEHPFYERYLIHAWPFIGGGLACLFPRFINTRTSIMLVIYTVFSILMLVKY